MGFTNSSVSRVKCWNAGKETLRIHPFASSSKSSPQTDFAYILKTLILMIATRLQRQNSSRSRMTNLKSDAILVARDDREAASRRPVASTAFALLAYFHHQLHSLRFSHPGATRRSSAGSSSDFLSSSIQQGLAVASIPWVRKEATLDRSNFSTQIEPLHQSATY
jgi:hypothetical protein